MVNEQNPQSLDLTQRQEMLCRRLDELYGDSGLSPSKMFKGALIMIKSKNNPDWISQAANSLREIIYPLWSPRIQVMPYKKAKAFKNYGSVYASEVEEKIDEIYSDLNDLTHHSIENKPDIEKLLPEFETVMLEALTRQMDLHKEIDQIVSTSPQVEHKEKLDRLNADGIQYFFSKADEEWLDWLWQNGLLDNIKKKADDPTRYAYKTPQLRYLGQMANKAPQKVVDIMLEIPISAENFNPEVIDTFLNICNVLPADQVARVVEKIRDERWFSLMGSFNPYVLQYRELLKTLKSAKDYQSLLVLAQAMLAVRKKKTTEAFFLPYDNLFYLKGLTDARFFKFLIDAEDEDYLELAFNLISKVMAQVVVSRGEDKPGEVFTVYDHSMLAEVDFFTLRFGEKNHYQHSSELYDLIMSFKVLSKRLFMSQHSNPEKIKQLYDQYVGALPNSQAMWRLRLYIKSLRPDVFKNELKNALFRLFEDDRSIVIWLCGVEYEKALQRGFSVLSDEDKRDYVRKLIDHFVEESKKRQDKPILRWGSEVLSMIMDQLTPEEKELTKQEGFELDPNYKPQPLMSMSETRSVTPQGPMNEDEFGELPVHEIIAKLQQEWTPDELAAQDKGGDMFNPLNAEGLGKMLSNDIPKRLQEYVDNATKFLDPKLDLHYTYSFLHGIEETIKRDLESSTKIDWEQLINLCVSVSKLGVKNPPKRSNVEHAPFGGGLLIGWKGVLSAMIDTLKMLLTENKGTTIIDFGKYRSRILTILSYPLSYSDPTPADERIETAQSKIQRSAREGYVVSDPFMIAINSVRGRAFEALLRFVYQDGKRMEGEIRIADDTKELYENVLKNENTRALMLMFGHHLQVFYSRDPVWTLRQLPQIFPQELRKKDLYTAAWEGFLGNQLFGDLFEDSAIQKLYYRGLKLTERDFPSEQEHSTNPAEGVAAHLATAYMYYEEFKCGHPLFDAFWEKKKGSMRTHFVGFLGRSFVLQGGEFFEKYPERKEWLKDFWDWMLDNCQSPKPFTGFGFWMNLENEIYDPDWLAERIKRTLEKTKGMLGQHYYRIVKIMVPLAEKAPNNTLKIIRLYLLEGDAQKNMLMLDEEWYKALKILHDNTETKSDTKILINQLIEKHGAIFWELKKILGDET